MRASNGGGQTPGHGGESGGGGTAVIEVWEDRDLFWRWLYRPSGDGREIRSARNYQTREAATEAARLSYPSLPIRQRRARSKLGKGPARPTRVFLVLLLVVLLGLAVVGALTVTALVATRMIVRRLRRIS